LQEIGYERVLADWGDLHYPDRSGLSQAATRQQWVLTESLSWK